MLSIYGGEGGTLLSLSLLTWFYKFPCYCRTQKLGVWWQPMGRACKMVKKMFLFSTKKRTRLYRQCSHSSGITNGNFFMMLIKFIVWNKEEDAKSHIWLDIMFHIYGKWYNVLIYNFNILTATMVQCFNIQFQYFESYNGTPF